MKILSCNIRYGGAQDGPNAWPLRKDVCVQVIRDHRPDIFGVQEMTDEQFAYVASALPEYAQHAAGRTNTIFYDARRYRRITAGGYWLSETPHVPNSRSWDSACIRLVNWVCLADTETGAEVRVVNTHLDHVSQPAQENQARLIVEDSAAWDAKYPQILMGDVNVSSGDPAIAVLKAGGWRDTYGAVHGTENPGNTYHEFKGSRYEGPLGKIDWIFMRGALRVRDAAIVEDAPGDRYPSDHYFLSATVEFEPGASDD